MKRAALAALAVVLAGCGGRPRDVVVITLDTFRADRLGCYGSTRGLTPRLDAFAREAVVFADASCAVPLTLPSHAVIFTGRYPSTTGVRNNGAFVVPASETTLAEALAARGWRTGAVIAAFPLKARFGLSQGFEIFDEDLPAVALEPGRTFAVHFAERDATAVTDRALAVWARLAGKPRFLWAHYFDAHAPYTAPARFAAAHPDAPYDAEVAYVDEQVGRLLDTLERDAPDALIVIAGDHGESLGEHGEKTHGVFLYQSTVHVPLMIRAPRRWPKPGVIEAPVSLADVMPTVLGTVDVPAPPGLDGADLAPLIERHRPPHREVYAESYLPFLQFRFSPLTMLRDGGLKYIEAPTPELYDVGADPGERRNTWSRSGPASEMAERLAEQRARADAQAAGRAEGALDAEAEARLRSLGYASAGTLAGSSGPPGRDPKTMTGYLESYDEAIGLVGAGEVEKGLSMLRALVPQAPENFMVHYQIAAALIGSGRNDQAVPELEQVIAAAPEFGAAHMMLGESLAALGRLDDAVARFDAAARAMPGLAEPKITEGHALETRGRFDAAAVAYHDAIEREPSSWNAAYALLTLRVGRGDVAHAVDELAALRGEHAGSWALETTYADALSRQGETGRAEEAIRRSLALDPNRLETLERAAAIFVAARQPKEAIDAYRKILAAGPGTAAAQWGLAKVLVQAGTDGEADAAIGELERQYPRRADALILRGLLFERRGDREAAEGAYRKAVALDPGSEPARRALERLVRGGAR
ncbi:MAG TPA: sulfatase-like hydrolase/transferase [Candidatus Polarisedimenticolaceae bacterium]|nr:sulfatase-like hydrolase/transferase [Candidatus Polarisedimenticolaceae bacterium]